MNYKEISLGYDDFAERNGSKENVNLYLGIAVGFMIAVCGVIYVVVKVMN